MNIPQRWQRSRKAGDKQPDSCRYVGRGTKYGNPVRVGNLDYKTHKPRTHQDVVNDYRLVIAGRSIYYYDDLLNYEYISCFCALDMPCHCDAIIEHLKERIKVLA